MKCPICGEFQEKDHFTCTKCNRENICGSHYNLDFLVCSDCAKKMAPAVQTAAAKSGVQKKDVGAGEVAVSDEPEKSPFYVQKVKCPVCGTTDNQRWFQAKMYSEREIDLDKHVQKFMWTDKVFEKYHPPLYYIWHCDDCHYTDAHINFENPAKDTFSNFRFLKDAFIDHYHDDPRIGKIVDKLGENIDYDKMNHYQAIKLHQLAIFIQELMEGPEQRDDFKIGRYYLRLGWLYRELNQKEGISEKVKNTVEKLLAYLKKGWPEVAADEVSAMKKAIEMLNLAFTTSQAIKSVVAEVDLLLLVAGIHIKIKETEQGLRILNSALKRGQQTKQKIEQRIKEADKAGKPLPPDDMRRFDIQIKKLDGLMSKARDTMGDLKSAKMKEDRAKAKAILKTVGGRPPLEIRQILIKKGINKNIAEQLTPEPKKKFLGLF